MNKLSTITILDTDRDATFQITINTEGYDLVDLVTNALDTYGIQYTIQSWQNHYPPLLNSSTDTDTS
jgi:hypothetical protein